MEEVSTRLNRQRKQKQAQKLWAKVGLVVVAVTCVGLIATCFAPINYDTEISYDSVSALQVYNQTYLQKDDEVDKDSYNNLLNELKDSFSTTTSEALFSGKLNTAPKIENDSIYVRTTSLSSYSKIYNSSNKYLIMYFDNDQTIQLNGKDYVYEEYENSSSLNNTYDQIVVKVNDNTTLSEMTIYFVNSKNNYSSFTLTTYAVQNKLFDMLDNQSYLTK